MATAEARKNRLALEKAWKTEQREIRARVLSGIRGELDAIKERKRHVLAAVRGGCKRSRERVRAFVKQRRAEARAAINLEINAIRAEARSRCKARKRMVAEGSRTATEKRRAQLKEERREAALLRRLEERREREHEKLARRLAADERRGESDDEVRQNIDAELVPVFDAVRKKIGKVAGRSRTESFLHWVHEHEGEIWAIREKNAVAKMRALLVEEKRAAADLRKCGGRCRHRPKRETLEPAPF